MRYILAICASLLLFAAVAEGQKPPLLPEKDVVALATELSGETAKRNLEGIARFHRQRGSRGFHEAAELVAERLRAYRLSDVAILQFPADGKIFYGTQRSRPAWDAEFGTLDEVEWRPMQDCNGGTRVTTDPSTGKVTGVTISECSEKMLKRIASYEAEPIVLAEDSESADVEAELPTRGGTKFGGAKVWSGWNCELCAEPEDSMVGRRREPDSVGASGNVLAEQDVCIHGVAEDGACPEEAVG